MELTITEIVMDAPEGDGKPQRALKHEVVRTLREALEPIEVPGLSAVHTVWVHPPAKRAPEPAILAVRYSPSKNIATCRFMMFPEVSVDDARWPAYRVAHVRQAQGMMKSLLESLEERLQEKYSRDADLQPSIIASTQALDALARRYEAEASVSSSLDVSNAPQAEVSSALSTGEKPRKPKAARRPSKKTAPRTTPRARSGSKK